MKKEQKVHEAICNYIRLKYPDVIFTSESSGVRMTIGQAKALKKLRSGRALPDLMVFEPRGGYHGLLLEIKAEEKDIYTKKGEIRSTQHLKEQQVMIRELSRKGYCAMFVVGFDQAKEVIDAYMRANATMRVDQIGEINFPEI